MIRGVKSSVMAWISVISCSVFERLMEFEWLMEIGGPIARHTMFSWCYCVLVLLDLALPSDLLDLV